MAKQRETGTLRGFINDCTLPGRCETCGSSIKNGETVWLEMNTRTRLYLRSGDVPMEESDGPVPYCAPCARYRLAMNLKETCDNLTHDSPEWNFLVERYPGNTINGVYIRYRESLAHAHNVLAYAQSAERNAKRMAASLESLAADTFNTIAHDEDDTLLD